MQHLLSSILMFLYFSSVAQPDYATYTAFLQKHVSKTGKVNYASIQKDKIRLDKILSSFSQNAPTDKWKKDETMVYWINLYNVATIKLIADHFPLKSIMDLDGGKTWDVRRIAVGKDNYSLNQIENEVLRARFEDPRIHFALNCAAKSCPPLLNRAYIPSKIDQLLENQTRQFIQSGQMQISAGNVRISKIFEWYSVDFDYLGSKGTQGILNFLRKYSGVNIAANARIEYRDYDWSLNN